MQALRGYQDTAALKGAIDLDLFTAIDDGAISISELADRCQAARKGIRVLCDYLVIFGLLTKESSDYGLTEEARIYLSRRSPSCIAGAAQFYSSPAIASSFENVAAAVRRGGTVATPEGTLERDHPVWVDFAEGMAALVVPAAEFIARLVDAGESPPWSILDLAAGHGLFGITLATRNPESTVDAVDWPDVLAIAQRNARSAGLADDRYRLRPGNAFHKEFGKGYDLALITNFLHHFDPETCVRILKKVHAALAPEGRAITLEFVPNPDRVTPPEAGAFSLTMLVSTPSGDAYTLPEFEEMFSKAGFSRTERHSDPGLPQDVLISLK